MDCRKTGLFICFLRKQQGLTQAELADRIGVTDKAVSRWETGRGFPDVGLLEPLAAALGTSVAELLTGEPLTEEEKAAQSDSALLESLRYTRRMGRKIAAVLLAIAGVLLLLTPLFLAVRTPALCLVGAGLLVLAAEAAWWKGPPLRLGRFSSALLRPGTARAGTVVCLGIAFVLELTPYGAVLNFARMAEDGTIGRFRETYSYFSLMPFGYANFFPLLTGVLTVLLLFLSLVQLFRPRERLGNALFVLDIVGVVFSLLPLLLGLDFFSAVGAAITAALGLAAACLALANRRQAA